MIREEINNLFDKYRDEKDDVLFNEYTYLIDPEDDGEYSIFFSFGELIQSLSSEKISHPELLNDLTEMINRIISKKQPEYDNLIKMEILSVLTSNQILFLSNKISPRMNELLIEMNR